MSIYSKIAMLICCLALTACLKIERPFSAGDWTELQEFKADTAFPYQAGEKRRDLIEENYPRLRPGMSETEIIETIGRPDRVNFNNSRGNADNGWNWSYFIVRKTRDFPDRDDHYFNVYLDKQGKLLKVTETADDRTLMCVGE